MKLSKIEKYLNNKNRFFDKSSNYYIYHIKEKEGNVIVGKLNSDNLPLCKIGISIELNVIDIDKRKKKLKVD